MDLAVPKISVIVTCYQQADLLSFALESIVKQTFSSWECIIVNDGSPDDTEKVAKRWLAKDSRFKYIKQPNGGLSSARNTGIDHARSIYVMPLDADDSFPNNALEEVYNVFSNHKDVDFVFGNYTQFDKETNQKQEINCEKISENGQINIQELMKNWMLLGTSPCKKALWHKVNGYALKYSNTVQDMDFWIKALKLNAKGFYINKSIYVWHRSALGMNASYNRKDYFMLLKEHLSFIALYLPEKKTINTISLGFYSTQLLKEMLFFNFKHFFSVSLKNHVKFFLLLIFKIKKAIKNKIPN